MAVTSITYRSEDTEQVAPSLRIVTQGDPSQCIQEAWRIANMILNSRPWHFVSLEFISPMEQGHGDRADDKWSLTAYALFKRPSR